MITSASRSQTHLPLVERPEPVVDADVAAAVRIAYRHARQANAVLLQMDKDAEVDMTLKDGWMQAAAEFKANKDSGGYCVEVDPGIRTPFVTYEDSVVVTRFHAFNETIKNIIALLEQRRKDSLGKY